jgi:TonB family protein
VKILKPFYKNVLGLYGLIALSLTSLLAVSLSTLAAQEYRKASSNSRLKATKSTSDEQAKWWQEVLIAGDFAIAAAMRKQGAIVKALRRGNALSQKEQVTLASEVSATSSRFWDLLKEGEEKNYHPPILDLEKPFPINRPMPFYTEEARSMKIAGIVKLHIEFLSNGKIGEVKVTNRLYPDLDKKAVEAVRRFLFIPAMRDGRFVSRWQDLEVEFNLR